MKRPLITNSLTENEKITALNNYNPILMKKESKCNPDDLLKVYVKAFVDKNGIGSYSHPSMLKKKIITAVMFGVVVFLDLVEMFLYHRHFFFNFIVFAAAVIACYLLFKRFSVVQYLMKEVKARPDDDLNNILSSQASGTVRSNAAIAAMIAVMAAGIIVPLFIFSKPHIIYEKNESGGYTVRYYTAAVFSEKSVKIPETHNGLPVNEIRGKVFMNLDFKYIELPSSIKSIRASTFEGCDKLIKIEIPDGVTEIRAHAFEDCSHLTSVYLPSSLSTIGSSAFRDCERLKSIKIPEGVTLIGDRAFRDCKALVYVDLPLTLRSIGDSAFRDCKLLSGIKLGSNVIIGDKAFKGTKYENTYMSYSDRTSKNKNNKKE